jgi:predicted protein tyrosine phosphatase
MIEITRNLFIGTANDYETQVKGKENWTTIHACKEPYHRQALRYMGRSAPKEHPEYYFAVRENRLILNLIDANTSNYIPKIIIDKALNYIDNSLKSNKKCLVHCNQGQSRSPSIGLLYLAQNKLLPNDFNSAEKEFKKIYPFYNPNNGIRDFIKKNWTNYVK